MEIKNKIQHIEILKSLISRKWYEWNGYWSWSNRRLEYKKKKTNKIAGKNYSRIKRIKKIINYKITTLSGFKIFYVKMTNSICISRRKWNKPRRCKNKILDEETGKKKLKKMNTRVNLFIYGTKMILQ